jgi:hypothetical protein
MYGTSARVYLIGASPQPLSLAEMLAKKKEQEEGSKVRDISN